jgi:hypothetical protein
MGNECEVANTDYNFKKLGRFLSTRSTSILKDTNVAKHLSLLHDKDVIVSGDNAPNNSVVVCKSHYIDRLMKEVGIENLLGNPTYTPTTLTKEEILDNHRSVLCSFGISTKDEELDLPSLYWIPKLHKCPFKQRNFSGSAKCSTKPLSKLLTSILSAVKTGLQSYCDTSYSRGDVNQMWILKNSKDLLEYIQSKSLSSCNNTKTFDFSTLYTTIPLSKLKNKIRDLVQLCFIKKNDQRRYKYLLLGSDRSYVVKHHCDSTKKFSVTDIFNMLECLIDNIFAMFGGRVFQQTVDIPMGTICAPLVTDLFLYSYEADFIQGPLKKSENKLARSFNFIFRYIDDVLSLNNSRFGDCVDRIYPIELEIKNTPDTDSDGRFRTKLCDKRDDFNFPIVNFPFIFSNIPPASCIRIIYLSDYTTFQRLWFSYQDQDQGFLLTRKLLNQGFLLVKLKSSLRKIDSRHHDLVDCYGISDHGYVTLVVNTSRSFPHS